MSVDKGSPFFFVNFTVLFGIRFSKGLHNREEVKFVNTPFHSQTSYELMEGENRCFGMSCIVPRMMWDMKRVNMR